MNFNSLFEDPTFMMGASLLGNRSDDAMAQAIAAGQAMQRTKLMKQDKEQEREMEKARTKLYERQTLTAEQNAARKIKLQEQMGPLFESVKGMIGGQPQPQGIQNASQQPQLPVGDTSFVAPPQLAPTKASAEVTRLQGDLASLGRELKGVIHSPEHRMILEKEIEQTQQRLSVVGGLPQQTPVAQAQPIQQGMAPHRAMQAMGGLAKLAADDYSGIGDIGTALKPETHRPGDVIRGPNGQQEIIDDPGQRLRESEAQRVAREFREVQDRYKREYGDAPAQAQRAELAKGLAKDYLSAHEEANKASVKKGRMEMLQSYLDKVETGKTTPPLTEARLWLKDMGVAVDKNVSDAQAANMLSKHMAMELKDLSPGSITEWEQKQFQALQPNIGNDPRTNKIVSQAYIKQQQRQIDIAKIYREHKKNNKGEITDAVKDEIAAYQEKHPIFDKAEVESIGTSIPNVGGGNDDRYEAWKKSKGLK